MLKLFALVALAFVATVSCSNPFKDDFDLDKRNSDFTCFDNENCGGKDHGTCNNKTQKCECTDEYADDDCSYERKSQKIAFILEICAGFFGIKGTSYLYMGHTGLGVTLLVLNIVGMACFFVPVIGWIIGTIIVLGCKIWWIILWVYILLDKINDSHGYALNQNLN